MIAFNSVKNYRHRYQYYWRFSSLGMSCPQKRVNSNKHLTIDRVDFISERVSSRDEISRVNTF